MAGAGPEIAEAVLEMVEEGWGGFEGFCEGEMGVMKEDLEMIVGNISLDG